MTLLLLHHLVLLMTVRDHLGILIFTVLILNFKFCLILRSSETRVPYSSSDPPHIFNCEKVCGLFSPALFYSEATGWVCQGIVLLLSRLDQMSWMTALDEHRHRWLHNLLAPLIIKSKCTSLSCHGHLQTSVRFQTSRSSQPVSFSGIEKKYYSDFNPISWNVANHTKEFLTLSVFKKKSLNLYQCTFTTYCWYLCVFYCSQSFDWIFFIGTQDTRSKQNNWKQNPQQTKQKDINSAMSVEFISTKPVYVWTKTLLFVQSKELQ